jgi:hypothetical protein
MTTLKKLLTPLTIALLCFFVFTPGMVAQQVTGVSAILDVSNGTITTYSATEIGYATSAYYEPTSKAIYMRTEISLVQVARRQTPLRTAMETLARRSPKAVSRSPILLGRTTKSRVTTT